MEPVSYIAEAPSFSAGEIMFALLIIAAIFVSFFVALIAGIKGFHRLGRGQRDSFVAKIAPLIGLFDILLLLSTIRESVLFAIAPVTVHAVAFALGRNTRRNEPPPPAPPPTS